MRLDKFTQRGQEAIVAAQELAQTYNHSQIEPEHLLLALLQQSDGVVPEILMQVGANPQAVQNQPLYSTMCPGSKPSSVLSFCGTRRWRGRMRGHR